MGLTKINNTDKPPEPNQNLTTEFISHTIYRRYGDGRIFPVKTWVTQKGVAKPVRAKKRVETLDAKEMEEVLLWLNQ